MINKNFNNIEIPHNIDESIDKGIERIMNEKKFRKTKIKKIVGGIASGLAIAITVGITTPTFAEDLPIFKEIFKFFENNKDNSKILPENNLSQHTNPLGIISEDNGIKITVQEVVYDGEDVYASYLLESEEAFPYKSKSYLVDNNGVNEYQIKDIDWMWLEQRVYMNDSEGELLSSNHLNGKIIDDNTFIGIVKYEVPKLDDGTTPESFEANINIDYVCFPRERDDKDDLIYYEENKFKVEGSWNFKIPVAINKSLEEVVVVNEVKEGFKLEKIIKTPFYIKAKIVPLKEENQKINLSNNGGGKELQQHEGKFLTENGVDSYRSRNIYIDGLNDISGTMYVTFERSLNDTFNTLKIELNDYTILNQPCTEECNTSEIHENSLHPKKVKFDTQIEIN